LRPINPKFGAALAIGLEPHRQYHADVVGECRSMIDKSKGQPCSIPKGRVANHGIPVSVGNGIPTQKILTEEILVALNNLDANTAALGKKIIKRPFPRRWVNELVLIGVGMIIGHEVKQGIMTFLGNFGAGVELIQPDSFRVHPTWNEWIVLP